MDPNLGLSMGFLSLMFFSSFVPGDPSNRNISGSEVLCIGFQLHYSTWYLSLHWTALYPRSLPLSPGSLSPPRSLEHVRWTSIAYLLRLSISIFSTGPQGFSPPPIPHNVWSCFPFPSLSLLPLRSLPPSSPMTAFFSLPSGIETSSLGTLNLLTLFRHLHFIIYFFLADIRLLVCTYYACPFWVWVTSLRMEFPSSIHFPPNLLMSLFLIDE